MLSALVIFPCLAILWLMLCEHFGLVRDQPAGRPR